MKHYRCPKKRHYNCLDMPIQFSFNLNNGTSDAINGVNRYSRRKYLTLLFFSVRQQIRAVDAARQ